jgi:hypothetical protein
MMCICNWFARHLGNASRGDAGANGDPVRPSGPLHDSPLVTDLGRAYREGRLDRRLRIYLAPKVLIIDEMGYLPLDERGATIFFQLANASYERRSITMKRAGGRRTTRSVHN